MDGAWGLGAGPAFLPALSIVAGWAGVCCPAAAPLSSVANSAGDIPDKARYTSQCVYMNSSPFNYQPPGEPPILPLPLPPLREPYPCP